MADRQRGGSAPWLAFLAGIVLVTVIGLGVFAFIGMERSQIAEMQIEMPNVKIDPPEINLPEPPPAPQMPPSASEETAPVSQ